MDFISIFFCYFASQIKPKSISLNAQEEVVYYNK